VYVATGGTRHFEGARTAAGLGAGRVRVKGLAGGLVDGVGLVGVFGGCGAGEMSFGAEFGDGFVANLLAELVL
jgi:hypothetical protein